MLTFNFLIHKFNIYIKTLISGYSTFSQSLQSGQSRELIIFHFSLPPQAEAGQYKRQLSEHSDQLKEAQVNAQQQDQHIRELQRLMGGMEQESTSLREELMTRESEILQLRELKEEGQADRER